MLCSGLAQQTLLNTCCEPDAVLDSRDPDVNRVTRSPRSHKVLTDGSPLPEGKRVCGLKNHFEEEEGSMHWTSFPHPAALFK